MMFSPPPPKKKRQRERERREKEYMHVRALVCVYIWRNKQALGTEITPLF